MTIKLEAGFNAHQQPACKMHPEIVDGAWTGYYVTDEGRRVLITSKNSGASPETP